MALVWLAALISCRDGKQKTAAEDIILTEQSFEKMARDSGVAVAFHHFAAPDAVILRENDSLIRGKQAIMMYYEKNRLPGLSLTWQPDTVIVARGGDLGFTYGGYRLSITDSSGQTTERRGIFHTIWKKQSDGSWRFVWD